MILEKLSLTDIKSVITVLSEAGTVTQMNERPTHGLSFCLEGRITYIQNGKEFVSDREHAIFLPMGQNYVIRREKSGRFLLINFLTASPIGEEICTFSIRDVESFTKDFESMKRLSLMPRSRNKLFSLFYEIVDRICVQQATYFSPADPIASFLEEAYADPELSNTALASRFHISEVYLRRLFLEKYGTTPHQYLLEIRLKRAKQLLAEGYLPVTEIAELCGFSNLYHFSRTFKRREGQTPTAYMKSNKEINL